MALAKFGAIVTDMRGKLGGHVFQGNGLNVSVRTGHSSKGALNSRNPIYTDMLPGIQQGWESEPGTVKQAWADLAATNPIIGPFGDQLFLTARNMYVRHYSAFYSSGQTGSIDIANAVNDLPSSNLEHVQFNYAFEEIDVQFAFDRFSTAIIIYALPVLKFGLSIQALKIPFLYSEVDETPQDNLLWDAFFAKYPDHQEGAPVWFGVKQVNAYGFETFIKTIYGSYV